MTIPVEDLRAQIEGVDTRRVAATITGNPVVLHQVLSDQLVYVHSSGRQESKAEYIEKVVGKAYDYRVFKVLDRNLTVAGELVLDNGDAEIDIVVGGTSRQLASRYLMVWAMEGGNWRLLRFHASPLPRTLPGPVATPQAKQKSDD